MRPALLLTFQRILALADKEVRHVLRDPRTLYLALAMPAILLLLFGFGVSFDLTHMPVAFVDLDRTEASRSLRTRLTADDLFDDLFDDAEELATGADAERALVAGEVLMVVVIERGFSRALAANATAHVQLLIDGSDNSSAVQARSRAETAIAALGLSLNGSAPARGAGLLEARTFTRFNPEGRSAVFLVPGITAYVLAIVAVLLTALTVAREWERGSMAQLFATPVGRFEIVLGKLLPYLALGTLAVLLVVAVGGFVFDVPFRGSALALGLLSFLFLVDMLGQGLLISVVTQNQMVATQVATMSSMLPSMLLSGFVFPIENMPTALQWLSRAVPARYYVAALRGVLLRGNGLAELWPEALLLSLFGLLMLGMATARFKRSIA